MVEAGNASEDCAIVAKVQTNGIGRCSRKWVSQEGNLFASILKKSPGQDLGQLSLTTACAVREAILDHISELAGTEFDDSCVQQLKLHWPNDIYYGNLKVSGILMAMVDGWLVISIGVNANSNPVGVTSSTSLRTVLWDGDTAEPIDTTALLKRIMKNIGDWFRLLNMAGFSKIRNYWLQNINNIKCRVVIKNGHSSINGIFQDIDDRGRLVLEENGNRLFISSGDLFANQEGLVINHAEKIK
jgi:BirA family biotin operon repressor/biotin-[acetyl-CoA-carboxylase] ligase